MPYLSALDVCSWRGAIQIHVYLYLYLYISSLAALSLVYLLLTLMMCQHFFSQYSSTLMTIMMMNMMIMVSQTKQTPVFVRIQLSPFSLWRHILFDTILHNNQQRTVNNHSSQSSTISKRRWDTNVLIWNPRNRRIQQLLMFLFGKKRKWISFCYRKLQLNLPWKWQWNKKWKF